MYKLILLAGSLLVQFIQVYKQHSKIRKKIKLLHTIIDILPLSPTQLLSKLKNNQQNQLLTICKGTISSVQKVRSILAPKKQIIFTKLQTTSNNIFSLFNKTLLQTKQSSFLKLSDQSSKINIFQTHKSTIIPTQQIQLRDKKTIIQKFMSKLKLMLMVRKRLSQTSIQSNRLNKQIITQTYLPDNSQCAIFGTFIKQNNGICCYKPTIISPSKQRMIAFIQRRSIFDQIQLIILIIIVFITIGFLVKEIIVLYQQYKNKSDDFMSKLKKILVKSRVCKVCNVNLSSVLNRQCMHMVLCQKCADQQENNCKQCNKKIKDRVQMHVC